MERRRRATWRNHTGNQSCQPLELCSPESVEDIVEIVQQAEREHVKVRAVGSGHSWSDVALTGGFLLQPQQLAGPLELDTSVLRDPAARLVRVQGGTRIREINEHLWESGLAFKNLGGWDGQTIAGVISTSTHGSGLRFGPLSDHVRSLDMVVSGGRRLRIEPAGGPTDPAQFGTERDGWRLVQDDDLFGSAVVGMGCLGVIYAVTLSVRERFNLTETRSLTTWEDVRGELPGGPPLTDSFHWELLVNPYPRPDGKHTCVITSREPAESEYEPEGGGGRRPWVTELLATLPVTHGVLNLVTDIDPEGIPDAIDDAMERLGDPEFTDRSYRVFNIGSANLLPAYSSEIGVELAGDVPVRALECVFEVAERFARLGDVYATAPVALRFVKGTQSPLSMMEGRDTMMIELIMQTDSEGGFELLDAYERALYELGGRPHWGQVNAVTERRLEQLYPRVDAWRAAADELNASRVFDGPFSARVGLT